MVRIYYQTRTVRVHDEILLLCLTFPAWRCITLPFNDTTVMDSGHIRQSDAGTRSRLNHWGFVLFISPFLGCPVIITTGQTVNTLPCTFVDETL